MPKQELWFFVQETLRGENILENVIINSIALMKQLYIFRHATSDGIVQNALLLRHRREKLVVIGIWNLFQLNLPGSAPV